MPVIAKYTDIMSWMRKLVDVNIFRILSEAFFIFVKFKCRSQSLWLLEFIKYETHVPMIVKTITDIMRLNEHLLRMLTHIWRGTAFVIVACCLYYVWHILYGEAKLKQTQMRILILGHLQNTTCVMRTKLIVIVFLTDGLLFELLNWLRLSPLFLYKDRTVKTHNTLHHDLQEISWCGCALNQL